MGAIFNVPAMILYFAGGLWGLIICLGIVASKVGTFGAVIAFFLLPFTLYLAPFYAGFAMDNWFPLMVVYGSGISAMILFGIGSAIDGE